MLNTWVLVRRLVLLVAVGLLLASDLANAAALVFVSAATDKQIITYSLDEETGRLRELARTTLDGEPGALAVSPDTRLLLVAMRSTGKLKSLRIDAKSGRLGLLSTVDAGADPAQVSVDNTGRHLLTAYYVAAKISVHGISPDGKLSIRPLQEIPTAEKAHSIVPSPRHPFVFVPHTGPNAIYQFMWDSKAGVLAPNKLARLDTGAKTGPRHMVWHPRHDVAYVDNEQGSSVTPFRLDIETGVLGPEATVPTLPVNFVGSNSCAEIKIHPSGKFLYVSNRGHDSLAMFAVSDNGLTIKPLGQQPTETTPRSFDLIPSGRYLVAAGERNGKLAVYSIDQETGKLEIKYKYDVAPRLWWVLAVKAK